MNINGSKASNALGGKTARACDSCLIKRARWFCAAHDAFLCQSCDGAVHSANQLASWHERVRLETSSCKASPAPAWHTKKDRTPRHHAKSWQAANHQLPVVPEMNSDDPFPEETEDQLFSCRVPVFDEEFCTRMAVKGEQLGFGSSVFDVDDHELNLEELLSSCHDEFAADVESLLGHAIGEGSAIEGLIMTDENRVVKVDEIACHFDQAMEAEEMKWDFDYPSKEAGEEMREADTVTVKNNNTEMENESRNKMLRLNYKAVIAAWASQGSPWTDGI